jgi:hypothetical protein
MAKYHRAWKNCEECGKKMKRFVLFKGKMLCYICSRKKIKLMPFTKNPNILLQIKRFKYIKNNLVVKK